MARTSQPHLSRTPAGQTPTEHTVTKLVYIVPKVSLRNKGSERPIFRSDGWEHMGQLVFRKEFLKKGGWGASLMVTVRKAWRGQGFPFS